MVLHYAHLADMAGGVDAFLIGSELRRADDAALGDEHLSVRRGAAGARGRRARRWSARRRRSPTRRTGASISGISRRTAPATCTSISIRSGRTTTIDFVGIDLYHPLTDWRDEPGHADEASGRSPYDLAYLRSNIRGGEGFDWYYASAEDRDGAGAHADHRRRVRQSRGCSASRTSRPGGRTRTTTGRAASRRRRRPTGCRRAKPIWFTELGCPAVDKGANQPNVFFDPKSAQSALPYFSSGARDDLQQRAYVDAYQRFFDVDHPDFDGSNPVSSVYGGRMVDPAHLHLWAWDARPYPYFPDLHRRLVGRRELGARALAERPARPGEPRRADRGGDAAITALPITRSPTCTRWSAAIVVNEVLSARATLEPLLAGVSGECRGCRRPRALSRAGAAAAMSSSTPTMLVERAGRAARRAPPRAGDGARLRAGAPLHRPRQGLSAERRLVAAARRAEPAEHDDRPAARCIEFSEAERLTDALLRDIWTGRERTDLRAAAERARGRGRRHPGAAGRRAGRSCCSPSGSRMARAAASRFGASTDAGPARRVRRCASRRSRSCRSARRRCASSTSRRPTATRRTRRGSRCSPIRGRERSPSIARAEGGGFRLIATLTRARDDGTAHSLRSAPGPLGLFDRANAIEVELFGGALAEPARHRRARRRQRRGGEDDGRRVGGAAVRRRRS